jgi:Golgi phosphoprotein 3
VERERVTKRLTDKVPDITLVEELCLLAIDDDGAIAPITADVTFSMGLVGACLVELCLRGRLDAELRVLAPGEPPQAVVWAIDSKPTGEPALDYVLREVAAGEVAPVAHWTSGLLPAAQQLRALALERLQVRGVIAAQDKRVLWVLKSRRYPIIEGRELREAKLRIVDVLIGNSVPTPHDSVLIGLALIAGLLRHVFSAEELRRMTDRIDEVSSLDIVARAVEVAISDEIQRRAQVLPVIG